MRKIFKVITSFVLAMPLAFSACAGTRTEYVDKIIKVTDRVDVVGLKPGFALPHDAGFADEKAVGESNIYDSSLYYLNQERVNGADPGLMYVAKSDIVNSYDKFYAAKTQYMSAEDFLAEYGDKQSWIDAYSGKFYMTVTGSTTALSAATISKYGATYGGYALYESTNLDDWRQAGAIDGYAVLGDNNGWYTNEKSWAPEFQIDPLSGLYFMFFSCCAKYGNADTEYLPEQSGVADDRMQVGIAYSERPTGPYRFVTADAYYSYLARYNSDGSVYTESDSEGNVWAFYRNGLGHDGERLTLLNEGKNKVKDDVVFLNGNGNAVTLQTPPVNVGYHCEKIRLPKYKGTFFDEGIGDRYVWPMMDVDPLLNSKGELFMYFSQASSSKNSGNVPWVIKLKDFVTPEWDTLTHISEPNISTVYNTSSTEVHGIQAHDYGSEGGINEGVFAIEVDGWYYMSYSPFAYWDRTYAVNIAVSDNPYGPFVKLKDFNPVIGIDYAYDDYMAGTGHHSFVKAGDDWYSVYHCLFNPVNNINENGDFLGRSIGFDKVSFITHDEITFTQLKNDQKAADLRCYENGYNMNGHGKGATIATLPSADALASLIDEAFATGNGRNYEDKKNNDEVVPIIYGNGPTYALEPLPTVALPDGYRNVASDATVTVLEGDADTAEYINDGLFSYQSWAEKWETTADAGTLKVKLAWDKPMIVRNVMVYEPYSWYKAFGKVSSIVFALNSKPEWYPATASYNGYCHIADLPVDSDAWTKAFRMRHGHSAMATFDEIEVKEIIITITKDDKIDPLLVADTDDELTLAVSEIYVMGKEAQA